MKRYALTDLIKFHELENEREQTKFIKNGNEHFINLLNPPESRHSYRCPYLKYFASAFIFFWIDLGNSDGG